MSKLDIVNRLRLAAAETEWELPISVYGILTEAADEIERMRKRKGRQRTKPYPIDDLVYNYIKSCGARGTTDQQCQSETDIGPQTQTPSRIFLETQGYVKWNGKVMNTRSGKNAKVWVVTKKKYIPRFKDT